MVDGNDFVGNSMGVRNQSSTVTVNATYNWWGSPSGPRHASLNPDGSGDAVSDRVNFEPFLGASAVNPEPRIDWIPAGTIDFGRLQQGQPSEAVQIELRNAGTADLLLGSLGVAGNHALDFIIKNDLVSGLTLAPFESATADLVFSATGPGLREGLLEIGSNDPDVENTGPALSGEGIPTVNAVLQMPAEVARKGSTLAFSVVVTGELTAPVDGRIEIFADTGEECSDASSIPEAGTSVVFGCDLTFTETGPRQIQARYVGSPSHADGAATAHMLEIMNFADLESQIEAIALTDRSLPSIDSPVIQVDFQVEVRNLGPDTATNSIVLTELLPASTTSNWTCQASGGAVCPAANGSGDLEWSLDLPVAAGLDLYIEAPIGDPPPAELELLVAAATDRAAPNHVHDTDTSQNLALEITPVDLLFRDDFDEP